MDEVIYIKRKPIKGKLNRKRYYFGHEVVDI
jgi:hypothetical protein